MSIRATLLNAVGTPDRAWLMLIAGTMLLCREFVAPGRVLPGVVGGLGLILGAYGLSAYRIHPVGAGLVLATLVILAAQSRWPRWYVGSVASAALGTVAARFLIAPPWQISILVALATVPAAMLLSWLLFVGFRARKNKSATRGIDLVRIKTSIHARSQRFGNP